MKKTSVLESWKIFTDVAEAGSFRAVADQYKVAPSSLTRRMKQLEKDIGTKIFLRTPRGIELTEAGKLLYLEAKHYLSPLLRTNKSLRSNFSTHISILVDCRLPLSPFVSFAHDWQKENPYAVLDFNCAEVKTRKNDMEGSEGRIQITANYGKGFRRIFVANPHMIERDKVLMPISAIEDIGLISVIEPKVVFGAIDGESHCMSARLILPDYESALIACIKGCGLFLAIEGGELDKYIADSTLTKVLVGWHGEPVSPQVISEGNTAGLKDYLLMRLAYLMNKPKD